MYCSCRIPQDRKKMPQRIKCNDWFHQTCENIASFACMHAYITAKTKLLFELSIWLQQMSNYPYYAMQCWKRIHAVRADT